MSGSSSQEDEFYPLHRDADPQVSADKYAALYRQSLDAPNDFWRKIALQLHFEKSSDKGLTYNFDTSKGEVFFSFMSGAETNLAYNCLDRIIQRGLGDKIAYHWEGNDPKDAMNITYRELLEKANAFAAVLKRGYGAKPGDVVAIYLPMILEAVVAMLACTRIGVMHSVVFAGFSSDALATRIVDAKCRLLITADGFYRGTKLVHLEPIIDAALKLAAAEGVRVETVIVVEHLSRVTVPTGAATPKPSHDRPPHYRSYEAEMSKYKEAVEPPLWMDAEAPLFLLYTSGSTGKPKGIQHTTAGYMVYAYYTMRCSFNVKPTEDVFWCTADVGWITGHTYLVYGPLLNGVTSVLFEGLPTWPSYSRVWQIVDKYRVTTLYTSPTLIRALMAKGEAPVTKCHRSSLRLLGLVGETTNPPEWRWLYAVVGERRCTVVDTYWQTETGGHMLVPLPCAVAAKPGAAAKPFFGVSPVLLDNEGRVVEGPGEGHLCFDRAWPGMLRGVYGDPKRFVDTYFSRFRGYYFTGDGARRDRHGYIYVTGRVDDLMKISGHLLSSADLEHAITAHPKVTEAAVVAVPHSIKGSSAYAYVVCRLGEELTKALAAELVALVRGKIGAIAVPDAIQAAQALPKTRSGKVVRRILRKIAEGAPRSDYGDTTTLMDEAVVEQLVAGTKTAHRTTVSA